MVCRSLTRTHVCAAQDARDDKKKAADDAINAVLFQEALTKKDLARRALEKAAAKEKKEKAKEPDKRDIYTDSRDEKAAKELDGMQDWDDAKLQEVVKKGFGEVTNGRFASSLKSFRAVLQQAVCVVAQSREESAKVSLDT